MGDVVRFDPGRRRDGKQQSEATGVTAETDGGKERAGNNAAPKRSNKSGRKRKTGGNTLCRRGFHQWEIDNERDFDVREGKLVTLRRCARCGTTRTTLE